MKKVEEFLESISFDKRLYKYDIQGSIAHTKMLAKCKIIADSEGKKIVNALKDIEKEIKSGELKIDPSLEDIHTHIEKRLIEKIGDVGAKLHTARSRNDQVSLDMRLFLRDEIKEIAELIRSLQKSILKMAEKNIDTVMPGYTHLQHAQPILFSHWIMAYFFMLDRDWERFLNTFDRVNVSPLGAAALAGTSHAIDREYTARLLGFSKVAPSSMDAVSDRDFIIEFLANASLIMMHLSRLSEELILFSSKEFGFIELSDDFTTGSSIMPQKRNPDVCELIRGKTGRVYGNLMSLLTTMKSLPLAYNRDMQEDKVPLFDTVDTLKGSLTIYAQMLDAIKINTKRMLASLEGDFSMATDLADYLVKKGMPFRKAYQAVSKLVKETIKKKKTLTDLTLKEFKTYSKLFSRDVFDTIKVEAGIAARKSSGGTAKESVKRLIAQGKETLKK
ncbi:argininosuccinate lyase [bacterium]|nr:argininosuccinate lyase [bacterium]MCG2675991.1 argininosuccinate lyase [bacterium]MCG2677518.1 argininosuccinate lyase [bacterium]